MKVTVGSGGLNTSGVYVMDFDDDYHRTDNQPSTELEKEVRKIRRRYKSIEDYLKAVVQYNEYMTLMFIKYGGPDVFKLLYRAGEIPDYIPAKPRLKPTAVNRLYMKKGVIVNSIKRDKIDPNRVLATESRFREDPDDPGELYIAPSEEVDKVGAKLAEKGDFNNRVDTKVLRDISNIDYLEEYFNTKNVQLEKQQEESRERVGITDMMTGESMYDDTDSTSSDDIIYYHGTYMNRESVDELEVFDELGKLGWDSLKMMRRSNVSKKVRTIMKDNEKDKGKKKKKRQQQDDFMVQMVMDGNYDSYGDFEKYMLDMTSDNVFGNNK